jgi:hypothetical protein
VAPLETLRRFAAKQASADEVLRALVSHDGWFVPLGFAPRLGRTEFERIVQLSERGGPPPGELYVFTDEACLDLVVKEPLGSFVTPVTGVELFCALDDDLVKVKVNPGSPLEHFWYLGRDAVGLGRLWGQAVRVERLLADASASKEALWAALRTFEGFTVLVHPNGALATAVNLGGFRNSAMVFTAPDCVAAMEPQAPGTTRAHLRGRELFELLPRAGVDSVVFNPVGPGTRAVLPLSVVASVLQLA